MNLYLHLAILLLFKCFIVEAAKESQGEVGEVDNHTGDLVHDEQPLSSLHNPKENDQNPSQDSIYVKEIEGEPSNDRQKYQNNQPNKDPKATELATGNDSSTGSSMEFEEKEIEVNLMQPEFLRVDHQDDQPSDENIDENDRTVRLQYIALLDENPEDIEAQSKLPFVIQSMPDNLFKNPIIKERSKTNCYSICTALHSKSMYVVNTEKLVEEGTVEKYTDFVFAGSRSEKILPIPTCPMESSEQTIQPESYKFVTHTDEEILTINILKPVVTIKKIASVFWPSSQPCKHPPQLSFTKTETKKGHDQYNVGYVVKFNTPTKYCGNNTRTLNDNMIFFHLAYFGVNRSTGDTIYSHHYIPYYNLIRKIKKVKGMYTQYIKNEHIPQLNADFDLIYSERNQRRIFELLFPGANETYFNPTEDLMLVKQELMDQKMLPLMSFKQAALSYINIVPMYKIIRDHTWSKVEEAVSRIPRIQTITILTGVLNQLEIEGKPLYLDDATETQAARKTVTVPKVFYKFINAHVINHKTTSIHHFGIIIFTHNDPFEKKLKKVCPSDDWLPCEKLGAINVEQNDPGLGFTYCCKYSGDMAKVLGIEEREMNVSDVFDIDELITVVGDEPKLDEKKPKTGISALYKRNFDSLTQSVLSRATRKKTTSTA